MTIYNIQAHKHKNNQLNLQYEDYYDLGHVSKSGARKVSILLSHLLLEDFNIISMQNIE